jgi:RNA polymerase sigma-70 factor (ECF subfamily)
MVEESHEEKIASLQKSQAFINILDRLTEEQRNVVINRHYNDMSFKQIAVLSNCSINTAIGRMRYALQKLRKIMETKEFIVE